MFPQCSGISDGSGSVVFTLHYIWTLQNLIKKSSLVYSTVPMIVLHYIIVLNSDDILAEHCVFRNINNEVTLEPRPGAVVRINDRHITKPVRLTQGAPLNQYIESRFVSGVCLWYVNAFWWTCTICQQLIYYVFLSDLIFGGRVLGEHMINYVLLCNPSSWRVLRGVCVYISRLHCSLQTIADTWPFMPKVSQTATGWLPVS